jgi:hypothetical protein
MILLFVLLLSTLDEKAALDDEWWIVDRTAGDHLLAGLPSSHIYLTHTDLDESGLHSCYEYKAIDKVDPTLITHTGAFCYPCIIITGVRKASTSALYNLFMQHPAFTHTETKENCPYLINYNSILEYFNTLPGRIEDGMLVDGCLDMVRARNHHFSLKQ